MGAEYVLAFSIEPRERFPVNASAKATAPSFAAEPAASLATSLMTLVVPFTNC
jgi:hypothetical protein